MKHEYDDDQVDGAWRKRRDAANAAEQASQIPDIQSGQLGPGYDLQYDTQKPDDAPYIPVTIREHYSSSQTRSRRMNAYVYPPGWDD